MICVLLILLQLTQADFWNEYYQESAKADRVTDNRFADRWHYATLEALIIPFLTEYENPAILDIGIGTGHWSKFVKSLFDSCIVTGWDISQECIDNLNMPDIRLFVKDIATDSIIGEYDIIIAIGILHHIVEDSLLQFALYNISSAIHKGSIFIMSTSLQNKSCYNNQMLYKKYRSFNWWNENIAKANMEIRYMKTSRNPIRHTPTDLLILRKQ